MPFFLFLLILLPLLALSDPSTTNCSVPGYVCGANTFDIHYPFRLASSPPYCGHPAFSVLCPRNETLVTYIKDDLYIVNNISYADHFINLTNPGIVEHESCPLPYANISLDDNLYDYTPVDTELMIYVNCTREWAAAKLPLYGAMHNITCTEREYGYLSFYWWVGDKLLAMAEGDGCERVVVVRVSEMRIGDFAEVVKGGFGLTWKVDGWCGGCKDSGGVCGNDPDNDGEVFCWCSNGASNVNGVCSHNSSTCF